MLRASVDVKCLSRLLSPGVSPIVISLASQLAVGMDLRSASQLLGL